MLSVLFQLVMIFVTHVIRQTTRVYRGLYVARVHTGVNVPMMKYKWEIIVVSYRLDAGIIN